MEVGLGAVALIVVGVSLSSEVIAAVVSLTMVVPLSVVWCSVLVDFHRDWGVVHPLWGIGRVVLGHILSLRAWVVPLQLLLLRGEGTKVSVSSSKDIFKEYFQSYAGKGFLGVFLVCDRCWVVHYVFGYISW